MISGGVNYGGQSGIAISSSGNDRLSGRPPTSTTPDST